MAIGSSRLAKTEEGSRVTSPLLVGGVALTVGCLGLGWLGVAGVGAVVGALFGPCLILGVTLFVGGGAWWWRRRSYDTEDGEGRSR